MSSHFYINFIGKLMSLLRSRIVIPYFDGWRGLAILCVLLAHFLPTRIGWIGPFGVTLFFGLSGILMCELLFIKKVPFKDFFFRRFSRVIPTFWLYILIISVYSAALQSTRYSVPISEIAYTLIFLRTYLPLDQEIWSTQWPIGHL